MQWLRGMRDGISRRLVRLARTAATDDGWADITEEVGVPSMLSALLALRRRGVRPRRVVDAGACMGDWARLFHKVFPEARILMIEPQSRHAGALRSLVAEHGGLMRYASCLVGPPGTSEVDFVVLDDGAGTGSSVLAENSNVPRHVERLAVSTLDELVRREDLEAPDFLKLDVQGYEIEVLKGASACLASAEFVLLEVSLWPYNQGAPLVADVLPWMDKHGFRAYEIVELSRRGDGVMVQADVLFIRKDSPRVADVMTRFPG